MSPRTTPERRLRRRSATRAVVASLAVVAVTGSLAAFGDDLWSAGALDVPAGEQVAVEARTATLVCPAPVTLADPGTTGDSEFGSTPVETASTLQVAAFGSATTSVLSPLSTGSAAGPERTVQGADPSAYALLEQSGSAEAVRSTTSAGDGSDTSASASSLTTSGDLRGLAAASCAAPGVDQWLVGGGTELGSSSRLTLANPSRTPATVTLELWGPSGPIDPAGPTTYLVPPGEQVSTLVEGLAAQQRGIVVRASSTGALVTATLQHSVLDGLTARGVDLVVAGEAPATAQTLAGLTVEASEIGDDDVASVRLLAPEGDATATIIVLGADGQRVLRGAQTADLVAGTVTDVSLSGLPAGTYSVVVQSDAPVVAGAVTTQTGKADRDEPLLGTPVDRTWIASQRGSATSPSSVVLPDGTQGTVSLVALPAEVDGSTELADQVPIVYDEEAAADAADDAAGDDATDQATTDATAGDPTSWDPSTVGTLEVYGTDGRLIVDQDVELALGQTTTVDLADLVESSAARGDDDTEIGAVRFVPDPQASTVAAWVLTARASGVTGSISTLLPTVPSAAQDAIVVRRSPTVGLPRE
ncbi:DUF5719 family protein [Sanguibacter sp. Leaf3]|uniref:DUF5719 family protein n=1 Tax=Sanguibacter sp. Leaf3 TaxID=1736209 RepID=UPI0006F6C687|nr:DUF5719 family protein [Sanguibacter sp. Leaf3]KQT95882.1 hypothetical protein ASG53_18505 [Sanguibacter sp. Leaf3]